MDFLKKIISIKSYQGNDVELENCKDLISNELKSLKIPDSKFYEVNNNIIFVINDSLTNNSKSIGILLHYDVLRFDDKYYNFQTKNNKYYGIGVTSAKGAIAEIISILKSAKISRYKKIKLIFTKDETSGSLEGTQYLVNSHRDLIEADYYWIPDCSNEFISIGCYHTMLHEILISGDGGHPVYDDILDNTNLKIAKILLELNEYFDDIKNKYNPEDLLITFISIKVDDKSNIVPANGKIKIEFRLNPVIFTDITLFSRQINDIYERFNIKLSYENSLFGYYNKPDFSNELLDIIHNKFPSIKLKIEKGNHDGAYLGFKLNKEVIGFLPGGEHLHSSEEYVNKKNISEIGEILKLLVK